MNFNYDNIEIEIVGKYNFLGLTLSSFGVCVFTVAQQTLAGQARKSLFRLEHMTTQLYNLKPTTHGAIRQTVNPVLSYCAEVWYFHKAMAVEKLDTQFWRNVLHSKQNLITVI